jgi:lipopolysaccharide transport system permease protein
MKQASPAPAIPSLYLTPSKVEAAGTSTAWNDWLTGTTHYEIWATLAWYDVLLRYRRSLLGPLWLTLSMAALILGMGPLYATLFNTALSSFFPHLTIGIIFWSFVSGAISEGCFTYISAASYLKQAPYSRSLFPWRIVSRHVIYLFHYALLFLPVAEWADIKPSLSMLLVVPGTLLIIANLHAIAIYLGFISARFRDVPQIVTSALQLLMFVTPVFWLPESLPARSQFILYNPIAAWLEIVRAPLLGKPIAILPWQITLLFTSFNIMIAAITYVRCRRRVVYWV